MKKSVLYYSAMTAVLDSNLPAAERLEIIEMLNENRHTAEWCEKQAEKKDNAEETV